MDGTTHERVEDAPPLLVAVVDRVATLTLHRPEARNALDAALLASLRRTMRRMDDDDDVDVLVLTGTDPAFCAGLDLKELGSPGGEVALAAATAGTRGAPWDPISKPLIGAVNGVAVTGGLELALHCDFLIASERARFADTHARVGVMPGWGLTVRLPDAVGLRRALRMSLTGDYLDAATALAAGLVTEVVPHDALLQRVQHVATTIAGNDRDGVRGLLSTYRRIHADRAAPGLEIEEAASRAWLDRGFEPSTLEARRGGVLQRGRAQTNDRQ